MPVLAEQGHRLSAQYCRGAVSALSDAQLDLLECDFAAGQVDLNLEGIDLVFHLAGIAHQRADVAAYQNVNVDAPLALAEQALAAGVKRFVFVSSVKAQAAQYDEHGALIPVSESRNPYAQSKALAEQGLQEICRNSSLELFIVRPALVYSEHALGHLRWLRRWAAWHLPTPPAGGGRSMIALDDLVRLLTMLVAQPVHAPSVITVTDNESYSTVRLHAAFCKAMGRRPWLPSPPVVVWRSFCSLWDMMRNDELGATWARMAADERYLSSGLDSIGFRPSLNFEATLSVVGDAA
ncbi:NAD-dependent epimerase/dehydratase family protein [Congregibacter variabilis]|uniref:NAD-dependent epimerase/dehydratase family protein n=1 Tax=Congregibacter variabilis TaxID=3081200 RepID=A0ABZ0I737_9GAMM|nr:NAD-dependent epimerase/dehydratase family protein [Congregibacter sp. IMCC43200]